MTIFTRSDLLKAEGDTWARKATQAEEDGLPKVALLCWDKAAEYYTRAEESENER